MPNSDEKKPKRGFISRLFSPEDPPPKPQQGATKPLTTAERLAKIPAGRLLKCAITDWDPKTNIGNVYPLKGLKALIRNTSLGVPEGQNLDGRFVEFYVADVGVVMVNKRPRCGIKRAKLVEQW